MKKFEFEREYFKLCLYLLFVIIIAILFEKVISNVTPIKETAQAFVGAAGKILAPFVYALFISFFLNPFTRFLQNSVIVTEKLPFKARRMLSSFIALAVLIALIALLIAFVLPEIASSVYSLVVTLPETIDAAQENIDQLIENENYAFISEQTVTQLTEPFFSSFGTFTEFATRIAGSMLSFGKGIFNFLIGLIVAFYMLIYKDDFKQYWRKLAYAFLKPERAEKLFINAARVNKVFESFFIGKTLDSAIIGAMSFVVMNFIIKSKYPLLSSAIIGVTNMIPFFGPFIGGIPVVLINLFFDFKMALIVAVFILLLQQFDGYILGPKILGDSTGLSPFWVIASILIGSALFGFFGMLLGVPTFAAVKMFVDEAVDRRMKEKYPRIKTDVTQ